MTIRDVITRWMNWNHFGLNLIVSIQKLICLLIFISPSLLVCQTKFLPDSIIKPRLDSLFDSKKSNNINFESALHLIDKIDLKNSEIVVPYLDRLIEIANNNEDYIWSGKLNFKLAKVYMEIFNRPQAGIAYENTLHNYKLAEYQEGILDMHYTLSSFYAANDQSDTALKHAYEAIAICEANGDDDGIAKANTSIAQNLINFFQFERAKEFIDKALAQYEKSQNKEGLVKALRVNAYLYYHLEDYDTALQSINRAIDLSIVDDESFMKFYRYYFTRIDIYRNSKNFNKLEEQLDFLRKNKEKLSLVFRYKLDMETAYCAHVKGEYNKTKLLLQDIFKDPDASKNTFLKNCYFIMSENFIKLNQYDSAYHYHMLTHNEVKANKNEKSNSQRDELMARYEMGKKEATITAQKEIISQQRIIQWFIGGITALLGLLFYQALKNSKTRAINNDKLQNTVQQLEVKNKENEILLKEIHHRVKNNLQTVSSLLSLQSASISDVQVLEAIEDSKKRVDSIALIHQKLYQGENLASIEMREYFIAIGQTIIESFGMSPDDVSLEVDMPKLELDVDTAVPIGLITNELITNSLKHAFSDTQEARIYITMNTKQDNSILLQISDNGTHKDSSPRSNKSTGFGSMLIKLLAKQLGAELETSTENGTETLLSFRRKTKLA